MHVLTKSLPVLLHWGSEYGADLTGRACSTHVRNRVIRPTMAKTFFSVFVQEGGASSAAFGG
jgi:hypothetical protein